MKQGIYTLQTRRALMDSVWEMWLSGDAPCVTAPGRFVNIQVAGFFPRRPISVCDWVAEGLLRHHCRAAARDGRIRDTRTEENHRRCPSWVRT